MYSKAELSLYYGTMLVGRVHEAFVSDATWYGIFEQIVSPADGEIGTRLVKFIEFCQEWCSRSKAFPDNPPDAAEFDRFTDVIDSGKWFAETLEKRKIAITKAPVFFPGNEISW